MEYNATKAAELLTMMSNPNRLLIMCQLLEGEKCVMELSRAVGLSQSALSQHLAKLRGGKLVATRLWVTTARTIKESVPEAVEAIEAAGGMVVADTCLVVAPIEALGIRRLATNSAKAAFYAPGHSHVDVRFGTLEQCLETAVTGHWPGD